MQLLCFLVTCGSLVVSTAIEPVGVKVTFDEHSGSFHVSLRGEDWLHSSVVSIRQDGRWWASNNKDHYILKVNDSLSGSGSGQDVLGEFDTTTYAVLLHRTDY